MQSNLIELSIIVPVSGTPDRITDLGNWFPQSPTIKTNLIFIEDGISRRMNDVLESKIQMYPPEINVVRIQCDFKNPGSTRNLGLSMVQGGLVTFWDCDDYPNFESVEASITKFGSESWDYMCGDFIYIDKQKNLEISSRFPVKENFENSDKLALEPGLWRYIFKSEFISKIQFPALRMGEDQVFLGRAIKENAEGLYLEQIFYNYHINSNNQLTSSTESLPDLKIAVELLENVVRTTRSAFASRMMLKMLITLILKGSLGASIRGLVKLTELVVLKNQAGNLYAVFSALVFKKGKNERSS